ncbi:acetate kinase [Phormidium tenue FACHB-886]|nr:acetate kinase [Phormidium tenue FACHB-886]
MKILVLNAGSSSQKSCLYDIAALPDQPPEPLWEAQIDWTHQQGVAEVKVKTIAGASLQETIPFESPTPVMEWMFNTLWSGETQVIDSPAAIGGVGHRVVHGGHFYADSVRITPGVKDMIERLSALAPVHNPVNLEGIKAIEQILGAAIPQVAVFDTAFHAQMPDAATAYAIPYELTEQGIRRYGFHGTSHRYCAERTAQILNQPIDDLRIVTCHLGNGCSLAAIQKGRSVDTTMGFTPLDGLMMGSRSGSVDPSILLHLMRQEEYTVDQLDTMLNRKSGLLGVSGVSNDMRRVMEAIEQGNERAQLALDVYIHRLRSGIGAMIATLGGLDALVFTAGVGENAPNVRAAACEAFAYMGLQLDLQKNANHPHDQVISADGSTVKVLVIHTQEDWAIAKACWEVVRTA